MEATKQNMLVILHRELKKYEWAKDEGRWLKAINAVADTLGGTRSCAIDGPSWRLAWRETGMTGKPTYKALHALPDA